MGRQPIRRHLAGFAAAAVLTVALRVQRYRRLKTTALHTPCTTAACTGSSSSASPRLVFRARLGLPRRRRDTSRLPPADDLPGRDPSNPLQQPSRRHRQPPPRAPSRGAGRFAPARQVPVRRAACPTDDCTPTRRSAHQLLQLFPPPDTGANLPTPSGAPPAPPRSAATAGVHRGSPRPRGEHPARTAPPPSHRPHRIAQPSYTGALRPGSPGSPHRLGARQDLCFDWGFAQHRSRSARTVSSRTRSRTFPPWLTAAAPGRARARVCFIHGNAPVDPRAAPGPPPPPAQVRTPHATAGRILRPSPHNPHLARPSPAPCPPPSPNPPRSSTSERSDPSVHRGRRHGPRHLAALRPRLRRGVARGLWRVPQDHRREVLAGERPSTRRTGSDETLDAFRNYLVGIGPPHHAHGGGIPPQRRPPAMPTLVCLRPCAGSRVSPRP
jgi:hypothetical protein